MRIHVMFLLSLIFSVGERGNFQAAMIIENEVTAKSEPDLAENIAGTQINENSSLQASAPVVPSLYFLSNSLLQPIFRRPHLPAPALIPNSKVLFKIKALILNHHHIIIILLRRCLILISLANSNI
jgi:hypothetical protein